MSTNKKNEVDELVLSLWNKVKIRQDEIAAAGDRPRWKTSCTIGTVDGNISSNVNIQTIADVNKIVDLYAFILNKEKFYKQAESELGVVTENKYQGYSFDDWKDDFKTRIAAINLGNKKKELKALEARLDKLITPEQRRELELKAILEMDILDDKV